MTDPKEEKGGLLDWLEGLSEGEQITGDMSRGDLPSDEEDKDEESDRA